MTDQEFQYVKLTFQLHKMIDEKQGNSDEADAIRESMELLDVNFEQSVIDQMNNLSSFCYAFQTRDTKLASRYREVLFAPTNDSGELNKIFAASA
jgi:hypothetical protein